jgi:uncharacterized protein (TIGR00288 family)
VVQSFSGLGPEDARIAFFCDFENIALGVRDAKYKSFDIGKVLERLVEYGKIVVKKAYADWDAYGKYKRAFHEAGIELIEIPRKAYSGKNSADIRMVVDAMDLCYSKDHISVFAIASGDSDFSPLVSKLKENDKYVIGVGVKNSTSDLLIENCDEFIFYEDLVRETRSAPLNDKVRDLPKKQKEAFERILDALQALQRENKEVIWGSMIKQTIKRKHPEFNEEYYGYRSFSQLLEEAQAKKLVGLKKDQRSGSYIVTLAE